jgi:DNA repair exonuclease SbcCD ATPase subunit
MIFFSKIRWKNFLSTGQNFTEIFLDRNPTTLILGENGSGKSTMLDALTFSLFGKPFRNINKPQLINSINEKNAIVEVEFTIGKKNYLVRRGIKPNVFDILCDDVLVNQDAKSKDYQDHLEKNILKMNFKSFTQIVILGSSSFVPFMQLKAPDRRAIVEDLLDIQIFSTMNQLLKFKISDNKTELKDNDVQVELNQSHIEMQEEYISKMKENNEELINTNRKNVEDSEKQIKALNKKIKNISDEIEGLTLKISDHNKVQKKYQKLQQYNDEIQKNIKKIEKEIVFYSQNTDCPTCKQSIDHDHRSCEITNKNVKKEELLKAIDKLESEFENIFDRMKEIENIQTKINELNVDVSKNNVSISALNQYISKINDEINLLTVKGADVNDSLEKLKTYQKNKKFLHEQKENLINQKELYDIAYTLLKDSGIKTRIIKQYLPIMNKLINKYLSSMDFYVSFNLDENFNETIKSRFRDEFTYASFSEGEKSRIDLALIMAWRAIAKLKNSMNTNLLVLDEVFDSSLDSEGTEDLLKILTSIGKNTNIFVISHKGEILIDKFRSIIRFEKIKNFSRIV